MLLFLPVVAGAMGRVPPRRADFRSADGRYRVALLWTPGRAEGHAAAFFSERPGGGPFVVRSTFTLATGGPPEAGFVADGGRELLTLDEPGDPEQTALVVYSLPSGRTLVTLKLSDLLYRGVRESYADPEAPRWAPRTGFKSDWYEGRVRGAVLSLPWGQSVDVNFDNGYCYASWTRPELRPESLDEGRAWGLFDSESSSAVRAGLLVYIGKHGSPSSAERLRALVDAGTLAPTAAAALARLSPRDDVFYELLSRGRSPVGRAAAGGVLVRRQAAGPGPPPERFIRAAREAGLHDPAPEARAEMIDAYAGAVWGRDAGLPGELRRALAMERDPLVRAILAGRLRMLEAAIGRAEAPWAGGRAAALSTAGSREALASSVGRRDNGGMDARWLILSLGVGLTVAFAFEVALTVLRLLGTKRWRYSFEGHEVVVERRFPSWKFHVRLLLDGEVAAEEPASLASLLDINPVRLRGERIIRGEPIGVECLTALSKGRRLVCLLSIEGDAARRLFAARSGAERLEEACARLGYTPETWMVRFAEDGLTEGPGPGMPFIGVG